MSFISTWLRRFIETSSKSTKEIREEIDYREKQRKDCGVAWKVLAERSHERARALNIDPPRLERKSFAERYNESPTNASDIKAQIAIREAQGKQCGVLYEKLADIT